MDLTLKQLGVDYLDLYRTFLNVIYTCDRGPFTRASVSVIHWPVCFPKGPLITYDDPKNPKEILVCDDFTLVETWKAMIKIKETGKV